MTRTSTSTTTIAVAADYADAMMTARRAKNWLFIILLLILLAQLTIFFLVRFNVLKLGDTLSVPVGIDTRPSTDVEADDADDAAAATNPATAPTGTDITAETRSYPVADVLRYVIPVMNYLGITLMIVLAVVLLLLTLIMLVGRLIGVSHVTSAFIWSILLIVLLFPWQSFLLSGPRDASPGGADTVAADPSFKLPGVLYTWPELVRDYDFNAKEDGGTLGVGLKWARFAGFPIAALLLLLMVQAKSSRGLKYALGESEVQVEVTGGDRLT